VANAPATTDAHIDAAVLPDVASLQIELHEQVVAALRGRVVPPAMEM